MVCSLLRRAFATKRPGLPRSGSSAHLRRSTLTCKSPPSISPSNNQEGPRRCGCSAHLSRTTLTCKFPAQSIIAPSINLTQACSAIGSKSSKGHDVLSLWPYMVCSWGRWSAGTGSQGAGPQGGLAGRANCKGRRSAAVGAAEG